MDYTRDEGQIRLPPRAPLTSDDAVLIAAYINVGVDLYKLPYNDRFDRVLELIGLGAAVLKRDHTAYWRTWQRLLFLNLCGRLPSI